MGDEGVTTNHLAQETSPYLVQHAHNPVDWYAWGEEALEKSRREDKPIFLSIGYSACHWCHVMAHESFEDPDTAALLNDAFVSIKVDREERPDLDALYMRSVALMTGQGGWPLTVFLTPELKPFFGGTYFPKEERWGMPSFRQVLRGVQAAYKDKRDEVEGSSGQILDAVRRSFMAEGPAVMPGAGAAAAASAREAILDRFDAAAGGFGRGPKFPQPPLLAFLLDEASRTGDRDLREKVLFTLRRMEAGGVRDQVGGGFHRYAVDGDWIVPHYEKMLYDNAQLASLYFRAYTLTEDKLYGQVAEGILDDVNASMARSDGGFVAALDADSEGEEGKFYVWTSDDIISELGSEDGRLVATLYGLGSGPTLADRTLHRVQTWAEASRREGQEEDALRDRVQRAFGLLRKARERRVPPGVDTKVLTDWNALAATAFLDGYLATSKADYLRTGLRTLSLIFERCWGEGRLFHVWDGERARVPGFLSDWAYAALAEWRAYEATGDGVHLSRVGMLLNGALDRFRDDSEGRWVDAPASGAGGRLLIPVRDTDDGVLPSPLGVIARMFWFWERLAGAPWAGEELDRLLNAEGPALAANPGAQPLLAALCTQRALASVEVVVSAPSMEEAWPLLKAARRAAPPGALVLPLVAGRLDAGRWETAPLFRDRFDGDQARAYVCVGGTCGLPARTAEDVAERLAGR